jgi:hypothetical protein
MDVDEGGQLAATGCACSGSPAFGVPATCPRARSRVGRGFCRERSRRGRGGVQRVRPEDVETRVEAYGTVKLTNESLAFGALNTADDQVDAAIEELEPYNDTTQAYQPVFASADLIPTDDPLPAVGA